MILLKGKEYFHDLLNKDDQQQIEDVEYHTDEEEIGRPREEKFKGITAALKNNKAPGIDSITGELLKHGGRVLPDCIFRLILPRDYPRVMVMGLYTSHFQKRR